MFRNSTSQSKEIKKALYLVSTPIGNLEDITIRAINILKNSDYILCEDTRVSKKLLKKYDINSNLIPNHKFNEKKNINKILELLKSGSIISLISDAGTPSVSDPGNILVNACIENNIKLIPIPGASSVLSAISICGFSEKFFLWFFQKKKIIEEDLNNLSNLNSSIVFFVSPNKFNKIKPLLIKNFSEEKFLFVEKWQNFMRSI